MTKVPAVSSSEAAASAIRSHPLSSSHSFLLHSCCPGIVFPIKYLHECFVLGCFLPSSYHKRLNFGGISLLPIKNIVSQAQLAIVDEPCF